MWYTALCALHTYQYLSLFMLFTASRGVDTQSYSDTSYIIYDMYIVLRLSISCMYVSYLGFVFVPQINPDLLCV